MRRRVLAAVAPALVVALAGVVAGCGRAADGHHRAGLPAAAPVPSTEPQPAGTAGAGTAAPGGGTPEALTADAPASLRRGTLPQVGVTQRVHTQGASLAVTLRRVIDPLRDSGARLPRGSRAVGVVVQIRSDGPGLYDSSATGDVRLVASGGVVTPVLATRGTCRTPPQDFDRYITAGEDRVGCVAFAVANGATLDAVWFSPHAHRLGRLTWAP